MRQQVTTIRASVVAGAFMLASVLLGPIVQAAPQPSSYVLLADSSGFEAKKQAYVDKARAAFDDWGRRIDAWSDEAKAEGSKVSDQARRQMDQTWAATKARWTDLKAATADGWENARHSYEEVTQKLAEEWHKLPPSR
jgi:hypothetical protein